jgi:DNA replication and repair protein RecF
MHLNSLSLVNFKNVTQLELTLSDRVNCFIGDNGQGKTNLLDAIYHLSYTKSFFNSIDSQNIKFDQSFYVIQGNVTNKEDEFSLYCALKRGDKKVFRKNKKTYKKLADHIGLFPVVMITPYDINLVLEGSETRRRFLDALIAQFDKSYLQVLLQYNKLLKQRNALLKIQNKSISNELMEVYELQMEEKAHFIFDRRKLFVNDFIPLFNDFYSDISSNKEIVGLGYSSALEEFTMKEIFQNNRTKDNILNYTSSGVHRDDLSFTIEDNALKKFGSQGQQKTFLIALKLAMFEYIKQKKNITPILLLDDIFDKLDDHRVGYILKLIEKNNLGQTFITDTSKDKIPNILNNLGVNHNSFVIDKGNAV